MPCWCRRRSTKASYCIPTAFTLPLMSTCQSFKLAIGFGRLCVVYLFSGCYRQWYEQPYILIYV